MPTAIRASKYFIYDGTAAGATRVKDAVGRGQVYVSNMASVANSGNLYFTPDVGSIVQGSAVMFYTNGQGQEVYTDTWSASDFARDFVDLATLVVDTANFVTTAAMTTALGSKADATATSTALAGKANVTTTDTLTTRVNSVNTNLTGRFAKGSLQKTVTKVLGGYEDFVIDLSATMNDANYDVTTGIESINGGALVGSIQHPIVIAKSTTQVTVRVGAGIAWTNATIKVSVVCRSAFMSMT